MALSSLPAVILVEITGTRPDPVYRWLLVEGGLLVAATWLWQPARALRHYLVVMLAVFAVAYVLHRCGAAGPPVVEGR